MESNPGPRFADVAGTRTDTLFERLFCMDICLFSAGGGLSLWLSTSMLRELGWRSLAETDQMPKIE